jgi:hypothetical protein
MRHILLGLFTLEQDPALVLEVSLKLRTLVLQVVPASGNKS